MSNNIDELKNFLIDIQDNLTNLNKSELQLLVSYYTKVQMLRSGQPIKNDDWDWISLGLLMKSMYQSTNEI